MAIDGNKIILTFTNTLNLEIQGDGELKHFAIAGADKKFVWAKAQLKNNQIIVLSDEIKEPVAVRYAWANNPENVNLYSENNQPISPSNKTSSECF